MSLINKQVNNILNALIKDAIQNGRLPSKNQLIGALRERAERISGAPTFRPSKFARFDKFDVIKWNKEMSNVEFDIKILYEELVDQAIRLMKRTGWTDVTYRAQRGQLDRLLATLDDILFTKQNAEDHFLGFSETFTDYSKIDLENSTPGVLSLREESLLIPDSAVGTKRIKMEDKIGAFTPPIVINAPSKVEIISAQSANDAPFDNIFYDVALMWRYDVITRNDHGCEIQFTFPISEKEGAFRITRASIVPNSENEMKCRIYHSLDNQNYVLLPSPSDWLSLSKNSKEVALDFEGLTTRYIRVILRKESADETLPNGYRYSFGLRNISLYESSRLPQATYQTITMYPQFGSVQKVALETDDFTPPGCYLDYYIADETGEFLPIAPLGKPNPRAPQVVRFGDIEEEWTHFSTSGEYIYTYNSVDYYRANPIPISGERHFGLTKLYRGRNAWARETSVVEETQSAYDTFIQFTRGTQKLYTYKTSTITGESLTADDGTNRTVLVVPSGDEIYYDRNIAGHLIKPPYGTDANNDGQPKYAVAEVLAIRNDYSISGEVISISNNQWTTLAYQNLDEKNRPEVYFSADGVNFDPKATEDSDYKLEKWQGEGDYLTGRIKAIGGSHTGQPYARVNYTLRRDITHLVKSIDPIKGQIWLAHEVNADKFIVRYRVVPDNIIRKSIIVTQRRGEDNGEVYKEGSDYIINIGLGAISRPEGSKIPPGGSCYVDFQWVERKFSLETYTVWCYYDKSEPGIIEFTAPSIDRDGGETFYMNINNGRYDLSSANETPILSRGWYRFTVESIPITNTSSGIRKVLRLTDKDGEPIFSGTAWFSEIRAFRSKMVEVSEAKLKYGTRKNDHTTFAIDPLGYIILNFNPGNVDDLTTLLYDKDTDTLIEQDELFELVTVKSSGRTSKGIRLKTVLRRNPNVDPGTTPKVFGWSIRLSR